MRSMIHKLLNKIKQFDQTKLCATMNRYSLILQFVLSCLICFVIEATSRHSVLKALLFMHEKTTVFLYNSLIVFVTFLVVYLFKRRMQMRITLSAIWLFLGVVNGCVLAARVTPFNFADIKLVGDLFAMKSNYFSNTQAALVIIGVLLFIVLDVLLFVKGPSYKGNVHYFLAAGSIFACFIIIPMVTEAAVSNNIVSDYFENIADGYKDYGFVYGFSTSVVDRGMSKPENYSEENVEKILKDTEEKTTETNTKKPNVICVLLESFIDPYDVNFLKMSKDPIPTFHNLERRFTSGYLEVPVVGAGTANTEFEMLTGMSMRYFGTGEYPYKTVLKQKPCESTANIFHNLGYGTHVVHNNTAKFYSRNNAFAKMGFDTFTSKEMMNVQEYTPLGTWAKDEILISEVKKAMDLTEAPDYVYTITVQGHGAYPEEKIIENPEITVTGADSEEANNAWEYYVNMLHEVDIFIKDFTTMLDERGEDTVVVFFGDHLPSMNLERGDMRENSLFHTKYITWNNFDLPVENEQVTSYQLMSKIMDQIGIHDGNIISYHQANKDVNPQDEAYQQGLELLQYDILYGKNYLYKGGNPYSETEIEIGVEDTLVTLVEVKNEKQVEALELARKQQEYDPTAEEGSIEVALEGFVDDLLTDDLVSENQVSQNGISANGISANGVSGNEIANNETQEADTASETEEESSDKKKEYPARLYIYGRNFTPWSKVFVNDKKVATQFIDDHTISIRMKDIDKPDNGENTLVVNQMGGSTILRSSKPFTFKLTTKRIKKE